MIKRIAHTVVDGRAIIHTPARAAIVTSVRKFSDNVTYSGGQPGVQGGFYGAGGARSQASPQAHHRPEAVAAQDDIRRLREVLDQVSAIEAELSDLGGAVSGRSIELKSTLKKRLSAPSMIELLTRLEINHQPVWGLTQEERQLVKRARDKVNRC